MMNKCRAFAGLLFVLLLSACGRHYDMPAEENLQQRLETQITADGSKLFTFYIDRVQEPDMVGRNSRDKYDNGRNKYKNPAERNRDVKEYAQALLAAKIKASGYCVADYVLYEELISLGRYKARGECEQGVDELAPIKKSTRR